ncbi:MAG: hypothetical protein ACK4MQ_06655 [Hyphomonas sp.]
MEPSAERELTPLPGATGVQALERRRHYFLSLLAGWLAAGPLNAWILLICALIWWFTDRDTAAVLAGLGLAASTICASIAVIILLPEKAISDLDLNGLAILLPTLAWLGLTLVFLPGGDFVFQAGTLLYLLIGLPAGFMGAYAGRTLAFRRAPALSEAGLAP